MRLRKTKAGTAPAANRPVVNEKSQPDTPNQDGFRSIKSFGPGGSDGGGGDAS